jgi:hypothetical protein
MIDAKFLGLDRHGEAKGSGTDDEKGYVHGPLSNVRVTFGLVRTNITSSRWSHYQASLVTTERAACQLHYIRIDLGRTPSHGMAVRSGFGSCHSFFPRGEIHFSIVILLGQTCGKAEKFFCVFVTGAAK